DRSRVLTTRQKGVAHHVARDPAALRNPLSLVERPMNAEIDSALAILLLRLRERGEMPRLQRPHITIRSARHAVELVRDKRERDVIAAVEPAEHLEQGTAEPGVT